MGLPVIDRPTFTTIIPSSGKKVRLRPYTMKEESIMLMAKQSKNIEDITLAVTQILTNCLVDDIDVKKLAAFDVEHLMVRIREASVGEAVPLTLPVPKCSNEQCPCALSAVLKLGELTIPPVEKDKVRVKLNDTAFMTLRYPTLLDMQEIATMEKEEDRCRMMVAKCIDQIVEGDAVIHPEDYDINQLLSWVDTFTIGQFEDIVKFFTNMPTMSKTIHLKCVRCDKTDEITVKGLEGFFI